jgi:hypothetical protein
MMARWAQLVGFALVSTLVSYPSALSASLTKADLVGTWDGFVGKESLQFNQDGTFTFISPGWEDAPGTYQVSNEGVSLTIRQGDKPPSVIDLHFAAGRLVMSESPPSDVFSKSPDTQQLSIKCKTTSNKISLVPEAHVLVILTERSRIIDINGTEAPRPRGVVNLGTEPNAECTGYYRTSVEINKDLEIMGKAERVGTDEKLFQVTSIKFLKN